MSDASATAAPLEWPMDFREIDFDLHDVIWGTSRQNRFVGQTRLAVNVCWHELNLSYCVPAPLRLPALVHDVTEAYLVDIPRPLKNHPSFAFFSVAEDELFGRMAQAMKLPFTKLPKELHKYDVDIGNAEMIMFNPRGHKTRMAMGFSAEKERDAMVMVRQIEKLIKDRVVPRAGNVSATRKAWLARYKELHPQNV